MTIEQIILDFEISELVHRCEYIKKWASYYKKSIFLRKGRDYNDNL